MASSIENPEDLARLIDALLALKTPDLLQVIAPAINTLTHADFIQLTNGSTQRLAKAYLGLSELIDSESPYFEVGDAIITAADLTSAEIGGEFAGRKPSVSNSLYDFSTDGAIPLPNDAGSKTWYFHSAHRPIDIGTINPPDGWCRIVKTIEIKYEPKVETGHPDGPQKPHLIILYSGGDSGGGG
jgi:hypothetical protein